MNERLNRTDVIARSAGTWAIEGRPPPRPTVQVMAEHGLDIRNHRTHSVTTADIAAASVVLGMTRDHVEALRLDFPDHADKIFLFSEMAGRRFDVPDPYGSSVASYRQAADVIMAVLEKGYERIMTYVTTASKD